MPWNATVLSRIRHLHLVARVHTESLLMGEHRSRRVGQAIEFAGYQEYVPGMDTRRLDWRVWGKTDRFVVKQFETETQLPSTVVLDLSGDMATGATGRDGYPSLGDSKAGYAITLAATLLYFLHRHGEPVGLEIVAGEGMPHRSLAPRTGRSHLQMLFTMLATARPAGRAELRPALTRVGGRVRRRSWVAVISDGMEEPSAWLPALAALAKRKTDLRFFHLYDAGEWNLDFPRPVLFTSPETGAEVALDPSGARATFREVVREYVEEVQSGVVRWGGRYLPCPTDRPMDDLLRHAILDAPSSVERRWD